MPECSQSNSQIARPTSIDESTKEDIRRLSNALADQKTINQVSSSGKETKVKREELERARKAREAVAQKAREEQDGE